VGRYGEGNFEQFHHAKRVPREKKRTPKKKKGKKGGKKKKGFAGPERNAKKGEKLFAANRG